MFSLFRVYFPPVLHFGQAFSLERSMIRLWDFMVYLELVGRSLSYILCLIVFFLCLMLTCTESIYLQSFHFTFKYISPFLKAAHYRLMSKTIWFQCIIHRLLDSLVVECWLWVREVPGSIPSQGPCHIKDVIKMVPGSSLV